MKMDTPMKTTPPVSIGLHASMSKSETNKPRTLKQSTNKKHEIPKHIHQFWSGPNAPHNLMQHCQNMHPGWNYTLWTPESINKLPVFHNRNMFHEYGKKELNGQSDIVRYSILREMGGIYIDADTLCLRPLDPFLKYGFFASYMSQNNFQSKSPTSESIGTGVIGGIPQHPILLEITDQLNNQMVSGPAWLQVGPHHVMRVLKRCSHCNATGDIHILPYYTFIPYHHSEVGDPNIKKMMTTEPHLLPKVKRFNSFAMNLWGSTFNIWKSLSTIEPKKNQLHSKAMQNSIPRQFKDLVSKEDNERALQVLKLVFQTLEDEHIDYMLAFGSLIGAIKYNKRIPWDDDWDILISKSQQEQAIKVLRNAGLQVERFHLHLLHKVWSDDSPKAPHNYPWKFPFIDIVWLEEHSNKIKASNTDNFMYEREWIFPTKPWLFEGIKARIPANPEPMLVLKYGPRWRDCVLGGWDHKREIGRKSLRIACNTSWDVIDFIDN